MIPRRSAEAAAAFVARRRASWERLEELAGRLGRSRLSLAEVEELDRLTRRTAGDLARARTSYPGSDVEGYLSELSARVQVGLHLRSPRGGALRRLYGRDLPATFRARAGLFLLALGLFGSGLAAGALAVWAEPTAAVSLVPSAVREAVAQGRMWTDSLLSTAPGLSGSLIARNNVTVVALAFALGATGVGTAAVLFGNGLLLGAVAAHCARHDMLGRLLAFVAAHGPAEILALLLAGQAGFVIGAAMLAPGEWPRAEALRRHAREAGRLLALVIPLLAWVAGVEAFVSPLAVPGAPAKATLGLGLAAALLLYLAWPGRAARLGTPTGVTGAAG